jgi:hypothetical protein
MVGVFYPQPVDSGRVLSYARAMTLQRLDNVLIVVDDLKAAIAFFAGPVAIGILT